MKRFLPALGLLLVAATCDSSKREAVHQEVHESWDASVEVNETAKVSLDREEARVTGPVEVDREEEFFAPGPNPDGGAISVPTLTRRVKTATRRAQSTASVVVKASEDVAVKAAASASGVSSGETTKEADKTGHSSWGPSFTAWIAIVAGCVIGLAGVGWYLKRRAAKGLAALLP